MAKQSEVDIALASIDRQMAELARARDIIVASRVPREAQGGQPPKRTRRKRAGLPEQTNGE